MFLHCVQKRTTTFVFLHNSYNKNLAIANRSRVGGAHSTLRASTCIDLNITP